MLRPLHKSKAFHDSEVLQEQVSIPHHDHHYGVLADQGGGALQAGGEEEGGGGVCAAYLSDKARAPDRDGEG